jgi:hypothetical protein
MKSFPSEVVVVVVAVILCFSIYDYGKSPILKNGDTLACNSKGCHLLIGDVRDHSNGDLIRTEKLTTQDQRELYDGEMAVFNAKLELARAQVAIAKRHNMKEAEGTKEWYSLIDFNGDYILLYRKFYEKP